MSAARRCAILGRTEERNRMLFVWLLGRDCIACADCSIEALHQASTPPSGHRFPDARPLAANPYCKITLHPLTRRYVRNEP